MENVKEKIISLNEDEKIIKNTYIDKGLEQGIEQTARNLVFLVS